VSAHFSGLFTPLYHALGLHDSPPAAGEEAMAGKGHAGHGGMAKPAGSGEPSKVPGRTIVTIPQERQQLIGVRTGKVQRDRLLMDIRAVGIVEPDQTRLARIHSRISGWVAKVKVNFIGQDVDKGDPLLEIYSPDLLVTQEEYLAALKRLGKGNDDKAQDRFVKSTLRRLELSGVAQQEIDELKKTGKARDTLLLRSPIKGRVLDRRVVEGSYIEPTVELYQIVNLSTLWAQAKVYEYELPHVEVGQRVHVTFRSLPGKMVHSKVAFVEPIVQEMTRTTKVRVVLDNSEGLFRPGMYADLTIDHDMGKGLLVPETALLRTGERAIAFRVLSGGRYEPVEVVPGTRFGERFQVLKGLAEGDTVVTSAVFLIDAESRLKSAVGSMAGHQHGSKKEPVKEDHSGHNGGAKGKPKKEDHSGHNH
jgi:Cu(I)/Ag(I) efflux system membrane fusion protein